MTKNPKDWDADSAPTTKLNREEVEEALHQVKESHANETTGNAPSPKDTRSPEDAALPTITPEEATDAPIDTTEETSVLSHINEEEPTTVKDAPEYPTESSKSSSSDEEIEVEKTGEVLSAQEVLRTLEQQGLKQEKSATPHRSHPSSRARHSSQARRVSPVEARHYRREQIRARRRRRQKLWLGFAMIAGVLLFALILYALFFHDSPNSQDPTPAPMSEQSEVRSDSVDETSTSTENSAESAQSASSEAPKAAATGIFAGEAQPNANTGDYVQHQNGTGTNHNAAAGVYAYSTEAVFDAMYGGTPLDGEHRIAFLTYDDGVNPESTPILLDELKKAGVPATFFMVGKSFVEENKPYLERIMKEGHALALHSFNHEYEQLYPGRVADPTEIVNQYHQSRDALQALLGKEVSPKVWRYPGGHMSWNEMKPADEALASEGVHWVDWNSMTSDAEPVDRQPTTVEGAVDSVITTWGQFGNPDCLVILMHDVPSKEITRQAVQSLVQTLREQGFSFGIME